LTFPSWLAANAEQLETAMAKGQLPHALLIHGPVGCGRRALALWLTGRVLGIAASDVPPLATLDESMPPDQTLAHPDLVVAQPEPDKSRISVERIRQLIEFFHLKSHQSGAKVAIINPAHAMSHSAANSLLKTLEEPPAGSLLILITDVSARLPATVTSRCQRLRVAIPDRDEALDWLNSMEEGKHWPALLERAGGSPLTAYAWFENGLGEDISQFDNDMTALIQKRISPVQAARRWASAGHEHYLEWLYLRTSDEIRCAVAAESDHTSGIMHLQNDRKNLNMDRQFSYLREIAELRHRQGQGINMELNLMRLFGYWYGGLLGN